ncbi:MAG: HD domain-containing phosphohydrolase [Dehalococcoidia bacterium]
MDPESIAQAFDGVFKNLKPDNEVPERLTNILSLFVNGSELMREAIASQCEASSRLARRLGLPENVQDTLRYLWEQWDGKGAAYGLRGSQIPHTSRILRLAQVMEAACRLGGEPVATAIAVKRRGKDLDPDVVDAYFEAKNREGFWAPSEPGSIQQAVLDIRPQTSFEEATDAHLEKVCEVIADFIDIKSPSTWGHSPAVAEAAVGIGRQLGLDEEKITTLRRAALVHDLGKVTVPCRALEKQENYSADELEQIRLHAYFTERILSRVESFRDLASVASAHHEWIDGTGYHRQLTKEQTTLSQRILALANKYALLPGRQKHGKDPEEILRRISTSVGTQFDPECYEGLVAHLQGEQPTRSKDASSAQRPGNLSGREVEVIRELAKGLRNREIAQSLVISEKTVERHLENIYNKLDVTCRTSAVVYAVQNGLIV